MSCSSLACCLGLGFEGHFPLLSPQPTFRLFPRPGLLVGEGSVASMGGPPPWPVPPSKYASWIYCGVPLATIIASCRQGGANLLPPPLCRYYMVRTLGGLQAPGFTFRLQVQGARAAKGGVLCRAPPWPAVLGWALKVTSPCCPRSRPSGSSQGPAYWWARGLLPAWGVRPHGLCRSQTMHPGFTVVYFSLP